MENRGRMGWGWSSGVHRPLYIHLRYTRHIILLQTARETAVEKEQ